MRRAASSTKCITSTFVRCTAAVGREVLGETRIRQPTALERLCARGRRTVFHRRPRCCSRSAIPLPPPPSPPFPTLAIRPALPAPAPSSLVPCMTTGAQAQATLRRACMQPLRHMQRTAGIRRATCAGVQRAHRRVRHTLCRRGADGCQGAAKQPLALSTPEYPAAASRATAPDCLSARDRRPPRSV